MPCSLPLDILDCIVDHLHDEPTTLKACCIVSKPWVPRAQKYIFAHVEFHAEKSPIERWKKTFPDPSKSPAHHTRSLSILGLPVVTAADMDVGGWISTFNKVIHLRLECLSWKEYQVSLIPFHRLSPTVRSLRLTFTSFEIFNLICSFPPLEDLTLVFISSEDDVGEWDPPLTSPKLTGSLDLMLLGRAGSAACRLLDLPDGLHFTKITVLCRNKDLKLTTNLVSRCSDTLESLIVRDYFSETPRTSWLDLSKAKKLKDLAFRWRGLSVKWVAVTLQTVESKKLQQITIHPFEITRLENLAKEMVHREWHDLDRLLVQFWTSLSIRPQVVYEQAEGRKDLRDYSPSLLPELTRRGLVDLVENPLTSGTPTKL